MCEIGSSTGNRKGHFMIASGLLPGALGGTRTPSLLIRSQMLYPLSYERWLEQYTVAGALAALPVSFTRSPSSVHTGSASRGYAKGGETVVVPTGGQSCCIC